MLEKIKILVILIPLFSCFVLPAVSSEIASVDVQKIVSEYKDIKEFNSKYETEYEKILNFENNARKNVAKIPDVRKKSKLEDKYNDLLFKKNEKLKKRFWKDFDNLETYAYKTVVSEAKKLGYDVVLESKYVLYSGSDITDNVINALNF